MSVANSMKGTIHNFQSHAWLQRGDLIVDITADQFDETQEAVRNEKIIAGIIGLRLM